MRCLVLCFLLSTLHLQAQSEFTNKRLVYVELWGNTGIYSLNYEHLVAKDVATRVGLTAYGSSLSNGSSKIHSQVPVMLNYVPHANNVHLELGAGYIFAHTEDPFLTTDSDKMTKGMFTASLGFKYINPKTGLVLKATYSPVFNSKGDMVMRMGWGIGSSF